MSRSSLAVLGECMLELSQADNLHKSPPLAMKMSFGGDTLNCALYLARLGSSVDYVTALGDDELSHWMIKAWQDEGIGCQHIIHEEGGVPGLYMIFNDASGERFFKFWRKDSPATRLFDDTKRADLLFKKLQAYSYVFVSGVSLGILSDTPRNRLIAGLEKYRHNGGQVIFDGNFRPQLWSSAEVARVVYEKMYQLTDIALSTNDDECAIFGECDNQSIIARLKSYGINEVVLKMGLHGCLVSSQGAVNHVPSYKVKVVDTTSAGDSFNAAYLHARFNGQSPESAAQAGHLLASSVIQHRGAILPRELMPKPH
jgi:2-dehydro-3-deoxygluconokinase